jgi:hypothetical protein
VFSAARETRGLSARPALRAGFVVELRQGRGVSAAAEHIIRAARRGREQVTGLHTL